MCALHVHEDHIRNVVFHANTTTQYDCLIYNRSMILGDLLGPAAIFATSCSLNHPTEQKFAVDALVVTMQAAVDRKQSDDGASQERHAIAGIGRAGTRMLTLHSPALGRRADITVCVPEVQRSPRSSTTANSSPALDFAAWRAR